MNAVLHLQEIPPRNPVRCTRPVLIHLFVAGLMLLLMALVGCGGGGGDSTATTAPIIDAQPTSQSAVSGASVTLSVTAHGDSLAYQWQSSTDSGSTWTNVAGATSASYTITALTSAMSGWQYRVTITSGSASVQSSAVTLTVTPDPTPPVILVQPADVQVVAGAAATFSVTASGTSLSYQWQLSTDAGVTFTDISGANAASYGTAATTSADNGKRFRVNVSNSRGSVTSNSVLLTVTAVPAPPIITTQPASSVSVIVGQIATFTVVASGNPAPSYQWQLSTDGGVTFADISGATGASYSTAATTSADNGKRFRVNVSNSQGSVSSNVSTLTVGAGVAPSLESMIPAAATGFYPDNDFGASRTAYFYAYLLAGSPTPTYQWQVSTDGTTFTNITGATSLTYTTPVVTPTDSGKQFRLVASNSVGVAVTHPATLNVVDAGLGSAISGLAVRPNGDILAVVDTCDIGGSIPTNCFGYLGIRALTTAGSIVSIEGVPGSTGGGVGSPAGIALDAAGNAYLTGNLNTVTKVAPTGVTTILAGGDKAGGFVDGTGLLASFSNPVGITIDSSGNLYVADYGNQAIRKVTPDGQVSTLAMGSSLGKVFAIAFDASGGRLFASNSNCGIFTVSLTGVVSQIAGASGCAGSGTDGPLTSAQFATEIYGMVSDSSGNIYLKDGYAIRKISLATGQVSSVANTFTLGSRPYDIYYRQRALSQGIAIDANGNIYASDTSFRIHKIALDGTTIVIP